MSASDSQNSPPTRKLRHNRIRSVLWSGLISCLLALGTSAPAPAAADKEAQGFAQWKDQLLKKAHSRGVDSRSSALLKTASYLPDVIARDRHQPEFSLSFGTYLKRVVSPERIAQGQARWVENRALFHRVEAKSKVPAAVLVALWGIESNFGATQGDYPLLSSLATLAYAGRRRDFFLDQLWATLTLFQKGDLTAQDLLGSWAGAIGQVQFIPTTYDARAVDGDGDGRRDLRNSLADALFSAANLLRASGWRAGEPWGEEVRIPPNFSWNLASQNRVLSVAQWKRAGVLSARHPELKAEDARTAVLVTPSGHRGPAFLLYENHRRILAWNRSLFFAIAVGHLADRLRGAPELTKSLAGESESLARPLVLEIQRRLFALGDLRGAVDGIIGSDTRSAIRRYQLRRQLPADGHASPELLQHLRKE